MEILRCPLQALRLLIMDEPTSVLTPQEVEILFRTLRRHSADGVAILYISHKLEETRLPCDHARILQGGRNLGTCIPAETSARQMAERMVGTAFASPQRAGHPPGDVVLELDRLSLAAPSAFGTALNAIRLRDVPVGHAGLVGGDLQIFVIGCEVLHAPEVLVVNQPTWGAMSPPPPSDRHFWIGRPVGLR